MSTESERVLVGVGVLVVEDHTDSLDILCQALEFYGAAVAPTTSLADARAMLVEIRPDVVMTDVSLGGDSGVELLQWMRAHGDPAIRRLPVIAVTGYPEDAQSGDVPTFTEWLMKPLCPESLRDAVLRVTSAPPRSAPAGP